MRGCKFSSQSGPNQVDTTRTDDCPQTDRPFRYITNHPKINSDCHPFGVGKSSISLLGGMHLPVLGANNTVSSSTENNAP